jgi:putative ABC transport system ATP-binding protein
MIELRNIQKQFSDGNNHTVVALKNCNLKIPERQFVVIVGTNGSGKSTFLNLIAGSYMPSVGEVSIENNIVNHLKDYERSKWIARMFQNPLAGTAPDLSIMDNFRLSALRTKKKILAIGTTQKFVEEVKQKVSLLNLGLENKLNQNMGTLSGGQRQALTLLMTTMDNTKLLLMDEPTAALDPRSAEMVMKMSDKLIAELNLTAILVTHQLKDAHTYGNRLLRFNEGEIVNDLNAEEKKSISLNEMYNWFN